MKALGLLAVCLGATTLGAQDTSAAKLPPMVTVTRQAPRSPLDLPFGITTVTPDSARPGQPHIAADPLLMLVPGLTVANRTNPSQDVRVSIRGFGARSSFGVRSIRVIRDGMPLTLPDGQTPLDYLDLESVGRIEVIRGAASALYGNASGGVIDIHSVDPPATLEPEARVWFGSNSTMRTTVVAEGTANGLAYQGNVGQLRSDNYRDYSHQRLTNAFGRLSKTIGGTALSLVGLGLHMPVAENPGALTQAQLDSAPSMADAQSVLKKARKEVDQVQIGLSATHALLGGSATGELYGGTRSLFNPLTFAVVDVGRTMSGGSVRADLPLSAVAGLKWTVGADYQRQDDDRKNWANCNGITTTSSSCPSTTQEKGVLQLDQRELVTGGGPYTRLELERGRLRLNGGARLDVVRFELDDHFLSDSRDDSGVRTMHAVSPMAGAAWRFTRFASAYANYSTAFETPTTTELGNHADGSAGLNSDLAPQLSHTVEVGAKGLFRSVLYDVAAFQTRVRDELIQFQVPGGNGRMYFRNAGATRRSGIEASGQTSISRVDFNWAYTWSHFRFVDFVSGTTQLAGKTIPGVPEHQVQASATWHVRSGGYLVGEVVTKSTVWANDANSTSAKAYGVANVRAGGDLRIGHTVLTPTIAVNNVSDQKYVSSVVINATAPGSAAPKFFEPGSGRTFLVGARVVFGR